MDFLETKMESMNTAIKEVCHSVEDVEAYIDERIREVKQHISDVAKKLPMPVYVKTGKSGMVKSQTTVSLYFVCPQTGFTVITETKEWRRWVKLAFGAACAGSHVFHIATTMDVEALSAGLCAAGKQLAAVHSSYAAAKNKKGGRIAALKSMYSSEKAQGEEDFDQFVAEPFLTSKEHDRLVEQLREAKFFQQMSYHAETATWVQKEWLEQQSGPSPRPALFSANSKNRLQIQDPSAGIGVGSSSGAGRARAETEITHQQFEPLHGLHRQAVCDECHREDQVVDTARSDPVCPDLRFCHECWVRYDAQAQASYSEAF
jgi:hypothetical protein